MMGNRYAFFRGCQIPIRLPHIEQVARMVLPDLGVELLDIKGFTCCPEPTGFSIHEKLAWLAIAARNISLAEEEGLDIITLCNGCYYTLKQTLKELQDEELRDRVNEALSETGHEFRGKAKVKHFVQVLNDDVGMSRLEQAVKSPLEGLRVAPHVGCHYSNKFGVDAELMDEMISLLGAESLQYKMKNLCCGWMLMSYGSSEDANAWLRQRLENMKDAGADCSAVLCPQCFYQFDMGQLIASRKVNIGFKMPVLFYLQLMGLAMGYSLEQMLYGSHRVRDAAFEQKLSSMR